MIEVVNTEDGNARYATILSELPQSYASYLNTHAPFQIKFALMHQCPSLFPFDGANIFLLTFLTANPLYQLPVF